MEWRLGAGDCRFYGNPGGVEFLAGHQEILSPLWGDSCILWSGISS